MAGTSVGHMSDWERYEHFLTFQPEYERSIGENMMRYLRLWRDAGGGGLTDLNAARRIIGYFPPEWREWTIILLECWIRRDDRGEAYINFPRFMAAFMFHWSCNDNHPHPPAHMGFPAINEGVQGYPPVGIPIQPPPPPHSPPPVPPPEPTSALMEPPPPSLWTLQAIPEHAYYPELSYLNVTPTYSPVVAAPATSGTHGQGAETGAATAATVLTVTVTTATATVPFALPSSSAGPSRRTARISIIRPRMKSPFRLSLPVDAEGNLVSSPRGSLEIEEGSASSGYVRCEEDDWDCMIVSVMTRLLNYALD